MKLQTKCQRIKNFVKRELHVVIVGLVAYAGVISFLAIGKPYWGDKVGNYQLVALVVTLMDLRRIFNKIKRMKGSWLIKLSVAFGEGFFAIKQIMPSISSGITQMRGYWRNIRKEL